MWGIYHAIDMAFPSYFYPDADSNELFYATTCNGYGKLSLFSLKTKFDVGEMLESADFFAYNTENVTQYAR